MLNFSKTVLFLAVSFVLVFASSCMKSPESKYNNEVITASNISELAGKIKEENVMSKDDIDAFTSGLIRLSNNKDSLINKKVVQIIELQKEFLQKQAFNNLTTTAAQIEMNLAMTMKSFQKFKYEKDTINADGIDFMILNNSDKDINAISGEIRFFNERNQTLGIRPVKYDNMSLKAGQQIKQQELWPHLQDNPLHVAFREAKTFYAIWVPESIVFAGGKKLTTQQQQNNK
jgi:hypothetical protein